MSKSGLAVILWRVLFEHINPVVASTRTVARKSSTGGFTFVQGAWGLDITKIDNNAQIYSISYFSLGDWSFVWGNLAHQIPPVATGQPTT